MSIPQYSWGYDPSTQSWGYFLQQEGDQSAAIGAKAGDKRLSYKAPAGDAASIQQEALDYLMKQQTTPTAAPAAAAPAQPAVAGSGIAAASGGGGGHTRSAPEPGSWETLSDAEQASFYNEHPTMAGITQAMQGWFGNTALGKLQAKLQPEFVDRQASIAAGRDPSNPQAQGTYGGNYGPMGGGSEGISVGGDAVHAGEAEAQANAAAVNAQAQSDSEAAAQADSARAAAAAAAEGAASDSHESSGGGNRGGDGGGAATGGNNGDASGGGDRGTRGGWAAGGEVSGLHAATHLPSRMVRGAGDGQSDDIPVKMDDGGDGRLADNEFVVAADAVSILGNGSSEAGARALYEMVDRIRQAGHGKTEQQKPVDPAKVLPA